MLKKLFEQLKGMVRTSEPFDPSCFNDPVAQQTDWTPAEKGGSNFQTHRLVRVDDRRMEFRASRGAILFYLLFLLIGLGVTSGILIARVVNGPFEENQEETEGDDQPKNPIPNHHALDEE